MRHNKTILHIATSNKILQIDGPTDKIVGNLNISIIKTLNRSHIKRISIAK